VRAPEETLAVCTHKDGSGSVGDDGQSQDTANPEHVDGAPTAPAVTALKELRVSGGIERAGGLGVDGHFTRSVGRRPNVDGAPAASAVTALENAVTGTRIDRAGILRIEGHRGDRGCDQPRVNGAPPAPAVGALEDAATAD